MRALSRCSLVAAAFAIASASAAPAFAEDAVKSGFHKKTIKNSDGSTSPYVVFVPHDYDGKKEFPVILFLHGAGETKGGS